jgi:hypothetical protein
MKTAARRTDEEQRMLPIDDIDTLLLRSSEDVLHVRKLPCADHNVLQWKNPAPDRVPDRKDRER